MSKKPHVKESLTTDSPKSGVGLSSDALLCKVKIGAWGYVSDYNMTCGDDGIIRVKDGQTLDDYINNPEIVKARKEGKNNHQDWILIAASSYEKGTIPHCA